MLILVDFTSLFLSSSAAAELVQCFLMMRKQLKNSRDSHLYRRILITLRTNVDIWYAFSCGDCTAVLIHLLSISQPLT